MFEKFFAFFAKKNNRRTYADKCILIVDDSEMDCRIIAKALQGLGCRVLTAEDGDIGYDTAVKEKPDLILSDCNMPRLSGVDMVKKLQENDVTENIPVIFLTGEDSPKNVIDCFESNAYNYMCKPINPKVLNNQIEEILQEHLSA